MGRNRLSILHISDFHASSRELGPSAWRRRRVLGDEWKKNLDALLEHGGFDLVCFTGDLAFSGKADEYAIATEFIGELHEHLRVSPERLFVVPGNHDIDRSLAKTAVKKIRSLGYEEKLALSRWMAGGSPIRGIKDSYRDEVLERQGAYRTWIANTLRRPELLPDAEKGHPRLGYRVTLEGWSVPVHIIGLDSAWLAHDGNDQGKLCLTDEQIGRLSDNLEGLRIGLIHHPLTDLNDGTESRRELGRRMDLLLRGHLHEPELSLWSDPDGELREMAAGCLYEHDRYPNACQRIDLTLDEKGRPVRYEVRFRVFSPRGFWHDDGGVYRNAPQGCWIWPPPGQKRSPDPNAGIKKVFVGRKAELRAIEEALLPTDPAQSMTIVVLQGMPGVGKSYLADRFAHEFSQRFPGGYLKLALRPDETRSADELGSELAAQRQLTWRSDVLSWEGLREHLARTQTLLHIENVDAEPAAESAVALCNKLQGCALILSGRLQGLGEASAWRRVTIESFNETTALEQLRAELRMPVEESELKRLAQVLGYLPLALHLAAGHLNAGRSVDGFLRRFRREKLATRPHDPADPLLVQDEARAILSSTFEISLDLLKDALGDEAEAGLLAFARLGHLPSSGFGESLGAAVAGLDIEALEDLLVSAADLSLITRVRIGQRADRAWSLHPLLAEFLRLKVKGDEGWLRGMSAWFLERLPERKGQEDEQGRCWKEIQAEVEALVQWLDRVPLSEAAQVEQAGSQYAIYNGPFSTWLAFCERLIKSTEDEKIRSNALWTLGQVALQAGLLERAFAAAQEKANLNRERGEDRKCAFALGLIADIHMTRGNLDEAMRIFQDELLPVYERLGDVRERALTLGRIADIHMAHGKLDEAMRIRQEGELSVYERLGDVRERAETLGRIADIHEARGELDEAMRIRQDEVLPVFERLGDVRSRAVTLGRIADIHEARGKLDEAIRIRQDEELPVFERLGDVRSRALTLGRIADIHQARGNLDEAMRIRLDELLPVYERLGLVRERAVTLGRIADLHQARGNLDEAMRIRLDEELPVFERLGLVHERALTLGKIADIDMVRGKLDEAMRILQDEVLPVYERLGDVRSRAVTLGKIADIHMARGKLDEAMRIRQDEELPVFERLGLVRERAVTLGRIADIHEARGKLDEAMRIRQDEELPVFERLDDVREHALTLAKIADIHEARGKLDEAMRIRQDELLPVFERLGDVRSRAVTLGQIADIHMARGNLEEAMRILQDEELPVYERLGDMRELLVARAKLALICLKRDQPGDRERATELLRLARRDAEAMHVPEAEQIRAIQQQLGLPE